MESNFSSISFEDAPIPAKAGVGLRHPHLLNFVEGHAQVDWVEVHAENYFCDGGPRLEGLLAVREHYPVSIHGVGLSLGSAEGISDEHLFRLKSLCDLVKPGLVSEHLSWSVTGGKYLNDLLPLPLNKESYQVFRQNIEKTQDFLKRKILIENPSIYMALDHTSIPEPEFLNNLANETGCGLLLDVNNIYVTGQNTGGSAEAYLKEINMNHVGEIHVAGHAVEEIDGKPVLIDTHGDVVCDAVWELLEIALINAGQTPVLMEWDTNIPDFSILMDEVAKVAQTLDQIHGEKNVA